MALHLECLRVLFLITCETTERGFQSANGTSFSREAEEEV